MYRHILIPTDGSQTAEKAVDAGTTYARETGARVLFFTAVPEYQQPGDADIMAHKRVKPLWQYEEEAALAALLALPASAQQLKTVDGVVVNFGLMSAGQAMRAEGHRDAHPDKFPSGSQHILITLADEKTGRPIGNADVLVEVIDPRGK